MHAHTLTYVYIHRCMHRSTHGHTHTCVHTHIFTHVHLHRCMHRYAHKHTHNKQRKMKPWLKTIVWKWRPLLLPSHISCFTVDAPSLSISIVLQFAVLLSCGDIMEREWILRVVSPTSAAYLLRDLKEFTLSLWASISLFVDIGCNACRVSGICNAMR